MEEPRPSSKKTENWLQSSKLLIDQEAIQLAALLCGQFPNASKGDEIFTRSIASLLKTFPSSVAWDCVNPSIGVATTTDFLTLKAIHDWCTERADRFVREAARQKRIEDQLQARVQMPADPRLLEKTKAWLDRADPIAQRISGQKNKRELERELAVQARKILVDEIGQQAFDALPDQSLSFRRLGDHG